MTFLSELAAGILKDHSDPGNVTVVFPTRRAALYFREELSALIDKPSWSPELITMEDLFVGLSGMQKPTRIRLIHELYRVNKSVTGTAEPFEQFYFWGDMLLRDFDEIDSQRVNAPQLFRDLRNQKELDETFDYLTDEQKEFLLGFWANFQLRQRDREGQPYLDFLQTWKTLPEVYERFRQVLLEKNQGYTGMVQRIVADRLAGGWMPEHAGRHIFAGFHGLTGCELMLVKRFIGAGASVKWDADRYYIDDERQEAGRFLRELKKDAVLGKTFPEQFPEWIRNAEVKKTVTITGVPQKIGQAKLLARELTALGVGREDKRTVVVVPDESMLLPVLHALPESLGRINVSMGYPIRQTPLFNLLDHAIDLQANRRKEWFGHRETLAILAHPYVQTLCNGPARDLTTDIIKGNKLFIHADRFRGDGDLLDLLFRTVEPAALASWLRDITALLGASFGSANALDREYAYHVHLALTQLCEILGGEEEPSGANERQRMAGFQRLFRQVTASITIPFAGEPLTGIQVMGALETRAVDFDNVLVLSMNEGFWPSGSRQGSFIPFNIRRAYSLPVTGDQEALSAYVFYRLIQRAKNIRLFHCTEADVVGGGETSRYIHQLIVESGLDIRRQVLANPIEAGGWKPVIIQQNEHSLDWFRDRAPGGEKFISPSMLNDYLGCRLKFYLNHIARMREDDEVAADLDARIFGNLLHDVMCNFYGGKGATDKAIDVPFIESQRKRIPELIDDAFRFLYHMKPGEQVQYEGQQVLIRGILEELTGKIVSYDLAYAPFQVVRLEHNFKTEWTDPVSGAGLLAGGNIDRVDHKRTDAGEVIRIMDYKSGSDETEFADIASLFSREGDRNKAAFQTFYYAWLVYRNGHTGIPLQPGLLNRKNLFDKSFEFGFTMGVRNEKAPVKDARPFLAEFESHLNGVLSEMIHPDTVFDQTTNEKLCQYCGFRNICRR